MDRWMRQDGWIGRWSTCIWQVDKQIDGPNDDGQMGGWVMDKSMDDG